MKMISMKMIIIIIKEQKGDPLVNKKKLKIKNIKM